MRKSKFEHQVDQIRARISKVSHEIAAAAERSGRNPDDIRMVAVTKTLSVETVQAAIAAGLRVFGENYAEQAAEKIQKIESERHLEWHMIGHIQSRKADTVCRYFDMVHSVDRMKIANRLNRYSGGLNKRLPVLLEVNLSGEESKFGWKAWDESAWEVLLDPFKIIGELPHLQIQGLMSMPPFYDDAEKTRPLYQRLRRLQAFLRDYLPDFSWDELSIGTTYDYPVAVEEGATIVRIGTAIFGERAY